MVIVLFLVNTATKSYRVKVIQQESENEQVESSRGQANSGEHRQLRCIPSSPCSVPPGVLWKPSSFLSQIVVAWHDSIGPDVEVELVHALRRLESVVGPSVNKWSMFSGTGCSCHILEAIFEVWQMRYGITFRTGTVLHCESNKDKQGFLLNQVQPAYLIADAASLSGDSAVNLAGDSTAPVLLPHCFSLDGGIPCTARTPLNSRSAANLNCVQEERESTGQGFKAVRGAVQKQGPMMVALECVKELQQKLDEQSLSDAEYICESLSSDGYWTHKDILQAEDWGAPGHV